MEKKKILIVEDDAVLAKMYARKFAANNFEVKNVYNGGDGIVAAFKENPNIILLDIMMPNMDGISILRVLKSDARTKNIPVIILTNLGASDILIDEVKRLGASEYLVKYKTPAQKVIEVVQKTIQKK